MIYSWIWRKIPSEAELRWVIAVNLGGESAAGGRGEPEASGPYLDCWGFFTHTDARAQTEKVEARSQSAKRRRRRRGEEEEKCSESKK